jgi:hypothetical protein
MTQPLFPHFSVPHFSLAPSRLGPSLESVRAAKEDLRLLVISTTPMPPQERAKLWPSDSKVRQWYSQVGDQGVTLVALRNIETFEIFTTHHKRELACSQALRHIARRCQMNPELWRVRVTLLRGMDVARHVFILAAGVGSTRNKARVALARMVTASRHSHEAGALSPTLRLLFGHASKVARRVADESLVGNPKRVASLREMVDINAGRVIEEELLNWRLAQLKLCRALALSESSTNRNMNSATLANEYHEHEAPSGTRIRAFQDHDTTSEDVAIDEQAECLVG